MSEETPKDATPETPAVPQTLPTEPPAASVPTEETPVAAAPAPEAPPPPVAPVVAAPVAAAPLAPAPAPAERKVVAVPMSVLVTLGAIVVAVLMFGIGYAVGNGNDDGNGQAIVTQPQIPVAPQFPNQQNGNGSTQNGNGSSNGNPGNPGNSGNGSTQTPNTKTAGSAFLGVATQATDDGLQITQIVDDSAASKAGLEVDDVITEFNGDEVTTPAQLGAAVAQQDAGDRVQITYTRDGQTKTVTVTLGTRSTSN